MNQNKLWIKPELEKVDLEIQDIITSSSSGSENNEGELDIL